MKKNTAARKAIAFIAFLAVSIIMLLPLVNASAATGQELSVLGCNLLIRELKKTDTSDLIDLDESFTHINHGNEVLVVMVSRYPYALFTADYDLAKKLCSATWEIFNTVHSSVSDAKLFVAFIYGDEIIFLVGDEAVMDGRTDEMSLRTPVGFSS